MDLPLGQIAEVARNGSPLLLQAVGRVFGLGQTERNALLNNGIPRWTIYLATAAAGVAVGVYVHKRWPKQINKMTGTK